jgi:hypothetical protein
MPRDACGLVVMEVTSHAMAAEPGANSLHNVAVDAVDSDAHFWDACSDNTDVRGRASIEQHPSPSLIQRHHRYDLTAPAAIASREYESRRSTERSGTANRSAVSAAVSTMHAAKASRQASCVTIVISSDPCRGDRATSAAPGVTIPIAQLSLLYAERSEPVLERTVGDALRIAANA